MGGMIRRSRGQPCGARVPPRGRFDSEAFLAEVINVPPQASPKAALKNASRVFHVFLLYYHKPFIFTRSQQNRPDARFLSNKTISSRREGTLCSWDGQISCCLFFGSKTEFFMARKILVGLLCLFNGRRRLELDIFKQ